LIKVNVTIITVQSKRKDSSGFIKVNCGTIPKDLLESEFFGYDFVAFTGAKKQGKSGLFEIADHGNRRVALASSLK
jgi:transcriptional regulator with PAS, ATPase and Fis domain